jgi:hypothetical protein
MRRLSFLPALACLASSAALAAPQFPAFRTQEIDKSLKVGYAVVLRDVNKDGKVDVVVCDANRVIWFDNANNWKLHTITQGQVKPDNVCIDLADIDGDGDLDLALGADWQFNNTKSGGSLQWLEQGSNIDEPWKIHPILKELPTLHRIRFADFDGNGKPELVVAPLKGRNSTQEKNLMDVGTQLMVFPIPSDPKGEWKPQVVTETLHVNHNVHPCVFEPNGPLSLLTASYEGVWLWQPQAAGGNWKGRHLGAGHQPEDPKQPRGSSEVKLGHLKNGRRFIATVEPFHGNYVVVYTEPSDGTGGDGLWTRTVLDPDIKWGHAVWCADLDGDGSDELVLGFRDPLPNHGPGVNVYQVADPAAGKLDWQKHVIEDKGVATEDLACADLNGDGRIDIVAVGRATGNARIYWNEGGAGGTK